MDEVVLDVFGNEYGYATVGECPIDYFPESGRKAERFTVYYLGDLIYTLDYIVEGDTRYSLLVNVEPDYRDGRWIEITGLFKNRFPGYLDQPKVVWVNTSPALEKNFDKMRAMLALMSNEDRAFMESLYLQGPKNELIKLKDED